MMKDEWKIMKDEGWMMKDDDFNLLRGYADRQTDWQTNKRTDICECIRSSVCYCVLTFAFM